MAYYLTIVFGVDAGTTYAVENGQRCAIGRGDASNIRLEDEAVAWEHAVFTVEDNRMFVENLSALGTKVNGRPITEKTRLSSGDRVEFAPNAVLSIATEQGSGSGSSSMLVVLALLLVVVLGAGVAATVLWHTVFKQRFQTEEVVITQSSWDSVFLRLSDRLRLWSSQQRVPQEFVAKFESAWRFEALGDQRTAHGIYQDLLTSLMVLPDPVRTGTSFAASATNDGRELAVYLGTIPDEDPTKLPWAGDEMHASALVWFVRTRHRFTRPTRERSQAFGL